MAAPQDQTRLLAATGLRVGAKLRADPLVQDIGQNGVDAFARPGFLAAQECTALIALIEAGAVLSPIFANESLRSDRTSRTCQLDRWDPLVHAIDRRIAALLGLREQQGETLQGQAYAAGEQFKPHCDWFNPQASYWPEQQLYGGQRSWTAMVYLDVPEAGGATCFPYAGFAVMPLAGMLIAWNNMDADGAPSAQTLHEGQPVEAGTKHIVTKWFRAGDWLRAG